jgi:hypothetical protein
MEFIRSAPIVVMRLEATRGVLWELEQAIPLTVLIVPENHA